MSFFVVGFNIVSPVHFQHYIWILPHGLFIFYFFFLDGVKITISKQLFFNSMPRVGTSEMQGPHGGLTESPLDSSHLLSAEYVSSPIPNYNTEWHCGDVYGAAMLRATQDALPPTNCLLQLLKCQMLSHSQANSSQIWLHAPGFLGWLGPISSPLLTLFTHIGLLLPSREICVEYLQHLDPAPLHSGKHSLCCQRIGFQMTKALFLGMPVHKAFFPPPFFLLSFSFFKKLSLFHNWGNAPLDSLGVC